MYFNRNIDLNSDLEFNLDMDIGFGTYLKYYFSELGNACQNLRFLKIGFVRSL